jgi:hypothetical protein
MLIYSYYHDLPILVLVLVAPLEICAIGTPSAKQLVAIGTPWGQPSDQGWWQLLQSGH